jgi:hypothetical protein
VREADERKDGIMSPKSNRLWGLCTDLNDSVWGNDVDGADMCAIVLDHEYHDDLSTFYTMEDDEPGRFWAVHGRGFGIIAQSHAYTVYLCNDTWTYRADMGDSAINMFTHLYEKHERKGWL